ncbi:hypothetical protein IWW45_001662 [Coemansia sp. RSA 485]|nr:hypothetical protein IWW45_001662 [Coemansia sp. RSA 485]
MLLLRNKSSSCVTSLTKHAYTFTSPNAAKELSRSISRLYSSNGHKKVEEKDKSSSSSGSRGSRGSRGSSGSIGGDTPGCSSCCATLCQSAHTPQSTSDASTAASSHSEARFSGAQTSPEAGKYCETTIRREFGYPIEYHAGSFPWLLSAERQRVPLDDLSMHTDNSELLNTAAQWLPLSARRRLAHKLNMHMARRVLGDQAIASVCDGAAMVLPNVARLLSAISDGSAAQAAVSASLSGIFSPLLLARFTSDLERLRRDNVQLALEVRRINSSRIHQIRAQAGPAEAFAALADLQAPRAASASGHTGSADSGYGSGSGSAAAFGSGSAAAAVSATGSTKPSLRAGLVRQNHRFSSLLGVECAAPINRGNGSNGNGSNGIGSAFDVLRAAHAGDADVRVRVDIELNVDMRYRLIGCHLGPSEYDMHNGTTQVIVDDDATRNLMLTLESSPARTRKNAGNRDGQRKDEQEPGPSMSSFEWRVADIDYLLSSEMRIKSEFIEVWHQHSNNSNS